MGSYLRPYQVERGWWDIERGWRDRDMFGMTRMPNERSHGKTKHGMDDRNHSNHKSQEDSESVASFDSTGKRKSFRRLCERFAEKTSMQGIPYIHNAKLIWAKLIWTCLLLGALGGMVFHLKFLIDNYIKFEKATKIDLGFDNLKFPAITLCNTNIIKEKSLFELQGAKELKDLVRALKPENLAPGNFPGNNQNGNTGDGWNTNSGPVNPGTTATKGDTSPPPSPTGTSGRPGGGRNGTGTGAGSRRPPNGQSPPPTSTGPQRVHRQTNNHPPNLHRPPLHDFNISEYYPDYKDYLEDVDLGDDEYDSPLDTQSQVYNLFTSLYMDLTKKTRERIGHNITEMLIACRFNQRICDSSMFRVHQTSEYGNCWTLQSRKFISRLPGPSGGLELVLYLQIGEYLTGLTNGYGMRLVVHHPATFPFPYDEGIFISAAMETSIGLKLRTITRIGEPHGTCEEGTEFKQELGVTYTRAACQASCVIFKTLEVCGCFQDGTEEIAQLKLTDARPCRSKKEQKCLIDVTRKYQKKEWTCTCQNPCNEIEYLQAISQRQWPTDDYARVLLDSACYLDETACDYLKERDERHLNYNFLKLNIYYEDLNYENVTESPEIETSQFLSDVGGAIGLWIGLSLLSLCELFQLVIELFAYCVHRTRNSNERTARRRERRKNRNNKGKEPYSLSIENGHSKGVLSVPDIKYELDSGSGRNSPHDRRARNDRSPRDSPRDRRFKEDRSPRDSPLDRRFMEDRSSRDSPLDRRFIEDRSPRDSPRGSPWIERRAREDFGMFPPKSHIHHDNTRI